MTELVWAFGAILVFFGVGMATLFVRLYRKVEQGKALIVSTLKDVDVTFTGRVVLPVVHKAEVMDISVKTIEIDRSGKDGLICQDNIRADIKVTFFVRVNKTREDVTKVAQSIGCARASDQTTLEELFSAKFSEALKTVGKQLDFTDLYTMRHEFRDRIIEVIGTDLNGYVLEDCAIDYLEQTPLEALNTHNILDAQGIRKITELTAVEHVRTNELRNNERKAITKQDVEAAEAILELERQKAEAEAKQNRETETVRLQEQAEVLKVQSEARRRSELVRIKAEEEIQVEQENLQRQVDVARKGRERVLAVESERVERERALEAVAREREVELQRIAKDKELEVQRQAIAEVVRERIVVEKTVAEQEEAIHTLRMVAEANRTREATVIAATAEAEEALVKGIKAAEASEQAAQHKARERVTLAEADLEAADKEARAKVRLAEGVLAEAAAAGLAQARVKEADAAATEKLGLSEAAVIQHKAEAMKALDDASRAHEEYRLRLTALKELELAAIEGRRKVAEAQASLVAEGLKRANIDIVGGESVFFDRLVGALSLGKAVDAAAERTDAGRALFGDYLSGARSVAGDVKEALAGASGAPALSGLTLGALLGRFLNDGDARRREDVGQLLESVRKLGLTDLALPGSRG
jgi:uncharacterized membrane protein YqiK